MIIDHDNAKYKERWNVLGKNKYNGAFYYSKEIVQNIIPNVDTDRNWITINHEGQGIDHAIVFVHNNLHPENYEWLKEEEYTDLIMVCGIPETCEKVAHIGTPIYLPLSVDLEYLKRFKTIKTKRTAFAGRKAKHSDIKLPAGIDYIQGIKRQEFLKELARYRKVYAVGRVAIEAAALGCEILPYDPRFPDTSIWKVLDNREAAKILQKELDRIDG